MSVSSHAREIPISAGQPAIRDGMRAALLIAAVVALGLSLLSQASPSFLRGVAADHYVRLQPFLGLMAIAVFAISAALVQRVKLEATLSVSRDEAEWARQVAVDANRTALLAEEVAGIGYWSWDAASDQVVWSEGLYRIYGRARDLGPPAHGERGIQLHPDDYQTLIERNRIALATGADYQIESRVYRPDGELRYTIRRGICQRDEAGKIVGLFGTVADITDLKRAQAAAQESESRFHLLADAATDMITRIRADGTFTFVSPSSRQVLGYEPAELVATGAFDAMHPEDVGRVAQAIRGMMRERQVRLPEPISYRLRHKDGRWVWLEANPSLTFDEHTGEAAEFIDVVRDVSQAKAVAAELALARGRAEAAAAAKSEFLANMSHELRTPLTSIIGFSRLLRERGDLGPEPGHYVKRIHDASEALLSVVNDVLDFSKLEAGQVCLDVQAFSVATLMKDTVELVALQAESKGLDLTLSVDPAVPALIHGDVTRLRQVLLNFVSNAVKFTAKGGVAVEAGYTPDGDTGHESGRLRITVADTGPGIAADGVERLFQRFSQTETSINRIHGGTGLGLAICKSLAELMGGSIGVETALGAGSTFWFEVPAGAAQESPAQAAPVDADLDLPSARILLVDDTAINRELVRIMLSPFGFSIEEASGGAEAVQAALERSFDLVLMDVRMPGIDGLAATRAIRTSSRLNCRTPILALTADIQPENIAACRAAGMNDHIGKPISPGELIPKIAKWSVLRTDVADADTAGAQARALR